jgi:hypothetical protein
LRILAYYIRVQEKIQEGIFDSRKKNEQTVKSGENPKKSYQKNGECAMI